MHFGKVLFCYVFQFCFLFSIAIGRHKCIHKLHCLLFLVPYIAPSDFTHYIMTYSSIFLSWLPIPTSQVPGALQGYKISFRKYHGNVTTNLIVDSTTNMRSVRGLTPFNFYWIEITGFTSAGDGPSSLVVLQMPPGRKFIFYLV